MTKVRNLHYLGKVVEQPYYKGEPLTKWIHDGVVVWENGKQAYKGIYYISNNASYAYSYLYYYDFETGSNTRLLSLRSPQNSYAYNLYVDKDGVFLIASQAYSGSYGYSYYGHKDISQRTRLAVGIGTTQLLPLPVFTESGIYVNDASTAGVEVLVLDGENVQYKTNVPEGEWDYSNYNVMPYGDSTLSGGSFLIQYDKNTNEYYRHSIYALLGKSTEQYSWRYSDSRAVVFDDSVFMIAWLRYAEKASGPYTYEEHLFVYDENGMKRHSARFTTKDVGYSNISLIAAEDKVYRVGNDDDGNFSIKSTTNGITYDEVELPDYIDVYTRDKKSYVRIVFNGADTYPASAGTKLGSALAKNIASQHRNHAMQNADDEIEKFNGLLYVVNGYYVYLDNYEMKDSDGNVAFQRLY